MRGSSHARRLGVVERLEGRVAALPNVLLELFEVKDVVHPRTEGQAIRERSEVRRVDVAAVDAVHALHHTVDRPGERPLRRTIFRHHLAAACVVPVDDGRIERHQPQGNRRGRERQPGQASGVSVWRGPARDTALRAWRQHLVGKRAPWGGCRNLSSHWDPCALHQEWFPLEVRVDARLLNAPFKIAEERTKLHERLSSRHPGQERLLIERRDHMILVEDRAHAQDAPANGVLGRPGFAPTSGLHILGDDDLRGARRQVTRQCRRGHRPRRRRVRYRQRLGRHGDRPADGRERSLQRPLPWTLVVQRLDERIQGRRIWDILDASVCHLDVDPVHLRLDRNSVVTPGATLDSQTPVLVPAPVRSERIDPDRTHLKLLQRPLDPLLVELLEVVRDGRALLCRQSGHQRRFLDGILCLDDLLREQRLLSSRIV